MKRFLLFTLLTQCSWSFAQDDVYDSPENDYSEPKTRTYQEDKTDYTYSNESGKEKASKYDAPSTGDNTYYMENTTNNNVNSISYYYDDDNEYFYSSRLR